MRLYHPTVRVFDAWGVGRTKTHCWRMAVEGWFTSLGSERVKVTFPRCIPRLSRPWPSSPQSLPTLRSRSGRASLNAEPNDLGASGNRARPSNRPRTYLGAHGFEDSKAILVRGGPASTPTSIATRSLLAVRPDGQELAITLRIGVPYEIAPEEWACPVAMEGFRERLHDVHGIDAWQAIQLVQNLQAQLLGYFIEEGGRLSGGFQESPWNFASSFPARKACSRLHA